MRAIHPDAICNNCCRVNSYYKHKCNFTAKLGGPFVAARSGRIGLSKDGTKCRYYKEMNK